MRFCPSEGTVTYCQVVGSAPIDFGSCLLRMSAFKDQGLRFRGMSVFVVQVYTHNRGFWWITLLVYRTGFPSCLLATTGT